MVRLMDMGRVTLGCAPSAGLYLKSFAYAEVEALFLRAVELGITEFDTAPLYGCGRSELDIGRFATAHPDAAARITIATKVGRLLRPVSSADVEATEARQPWRVEHDTQYYSRDRDTGHLCCVEDYSAEAIQASYRESRERLGPEAAPRVARLRIHDAETEERLEDLLAGSGAATLAEIKRAGVVASIGLGMNRPDFAKGIIHACPDGTFDHVLLAGAYNLIDSSGAELLEECASRGIEVHTAGVFGAGLLWGGDKYRYHAAAPNHIQRRDAIQSICAQFGVPLPWLAVHFATEPRSVTRVVLGCATVAELEQCVALFHMAFPAATVDALYSALRAAGLLPPPSSS